MRERPKGKIKSIYRPIKNGMYTNNYYVCYENEEARQYKIKFEMLNKHFNFMMNAATVERIESVSGKHIADRFLA